MKKQNFFLKLFGGVLFFVHVSDRIPTSAGANTIAERIKLLKRKEYPENQFKQMPKMTRVPLLTN